MTEITPHATCTGETEAIVSTSRVYMERCMPGKKKRNKGGVKRS